MPALPQPALADNRVWWTAVAGMLLLALLVATYRLDLYPLEAHEIFVAQTTLEMAERGDWVTPYFNGEPRLNKPPLNYWLTGLAAWLDHATVSAWHARLPSALAAVGLVGLTMLIGRILFSRATAIAGGLILLASSGFLQYSHNARPEMVYALFCVGGLAGFLYAWQRAGQGTAALIGAHLMWLSLALAILTKGPQMPVMFLPVFVWFLRRERMDWRQVLRILQPLSGIGLLLAVTLPWWLLLRQQLGGESLDDSQLSGELLIPSLGNLLDPYYLYRTPQLALPWLILFPVAIAVMARWFRRDNRLWLLLALIAVPALLFSLGPQRRWYYMLPVLVPMCVLLAASVERLFKDSAPQAALRRWLRWAVPGQWLLAILALAGAALWTDDAGFRQGLLWALAASVILGVALRGRLREDSGPLFPVAFSTALFLLTGAFLYASAASLVLGRKEDRMQVAEFLREQVPASLPHVSFRTGNEPYVYYAQRRVASIQSLPQLQALQETRPGSPLILILRRSTLGKLSPLATETLFESSGDEDPFLVIRLGAQGAP